MGFRSEVETLPFGHRNTFQQREWGDDAEKSYTFWGVTWDGKAWVKKDGRPS